MIFLSSLIWSRLKCFGTMLLHFIIIYQCRMAMSIATLLLLQVSLLLFSASHAQLARKIAAQASHNHDNVGIPHNVSSTGHKSFSVAPTTTTTTTTTTSSPHLEMVKDTDGDEESYITNSSNSMIIADLPANATRLLLSNSFTCPQAFFIFGDSLTDTGNIQLLVPGLAATTLNYPYGESYTFIYEPGHNRYSDGRLIVDFIGKHHEFTTMFQINDQHMYKLVHVHHVAGHFHCSEITQISTKCTMKYTKSSIT